jgi:hypothetical protein
MATAKSLPDLNAQVDSNFPDNTTRLITPNFLRGQQKDFIVSTPYSFFNGVPGAAQNVAAGYLVGKSRIIDYNTQIQYLYSSDPTTAVWTVITAGGTPGGSNTQLQWNNASAFGGISGATTDGTTVTLTSPIVTTSLTTGSTTFALLNTTATTINFGGAATTIAIGAATGTLTLNNATIALTATPSTSASFSTATILTRASGGNLEKIVASGGGTTNFLRADGTWAAPAGGGGMAIGGSITSATAGSVLYAGALGVLAQSNSNFFFDSANNRLGIGFGTTISARLALGASTATVPHFTLTPSAAAFTGTTDGMLTYQNVSGTGNLVLYKVSSATNILTTARNSDFATGSTTGVLVSDNLGNISKSAELTALGIFAGTADGATLSAAGNADLLPTTVVGSKTLPASFFGVGKIIEVFVSGKITTTNSPDNLVLKLQFGATPTDIVTITLVLHANITNGYWDARFVVVCRTTGASGNISANGIARMETNTGSNMVYANAIVPGTLPTINTANAQEIKVNGAITENNSVTIQNCYANYLN